MFNFNEKFSKNFDSPKKRKELWILICEFRIAICEKIFELWFAKEKYKFYKISVRVRNWKIFPFPFAKKKCWFSTRNLRKKLSKISDCERKENFHCSLWTDYRGSQTIWTGLNFELARKIFSFRIVKRIRKFLNFNSPTKNGKNYEFRCMEEKKKISNTSIP